jgi:hypothetical protein
MIQGLDQHMAPLNQEVSISTQPLQSPAQAPVETMSTDPCSTYETTMQNDVRRMLFGTIAVDGEGMVRLCMAVDIVGRFGAQSTMNDSWLFSISSMGSRHSPAFTK